MSRHRKERTHRHVMVGIELNPYDWFNWSKYFRRFPNGYELELHFGPFHVWSTDD